MVVQIGQRFELKTILAEDWFWGELYASIEVNHGMVFNIVIIFGGNDSHLITLPQRFKQLL